MKKCIVEYEGEIYHDSTGLSFPQATRVLTVEKELNRFQGLISAAEGFIKSVVSTDKAIDGLFASRYKELKEAINNAKA